MPLEKLVLLVQQGHTELMPELWDRVYLFIRKAAIIRINSLPLHMNDLTEDLINAGYFAVVSAVKSFQADKKVSFIHWLSFHLKNTFNDVLNLRTETGRNDPLRYAVSIDAPIGGDTEDITLADTLTDPEAEEAYNRVINVMQCRYLHKILVNAIVSATEDKPEARLIWLCMLNRNVGLSEAARRLNIEYATAKAARDSTRASLIRYIRKYGHEI